MRRRYYLLPTNFAFGTWVARLIAFVVADFAKGFRHAEIKRSIAPPLPIRAKLFGGPNRIGTWPPLSPKIKDFRGPRGFALSIRAKLDGAPRDLWVRETHPI